MSLDHLADEVVAGIRSLPPVDARLLIAVAGPPASGKSTLAEAVAARLPDAIAVPMDGFHLDNAILDRRDLRSRKGAPETFDAAGFVAAMTRLKTEPHVILPAFDRPLDLAIAGRIEVGPDARIAVVEGNYLCLTEPPWSALADLWDLSIYLDISEPTLAERLVARWTRLGFSQAEAHSRAEVNDLPNARRVAQALGHVDLRLTDG